MADESIKRLVELGVNATPAIEELERLRAETKKQTDSLEGIQKQLAGFGQAIGATFGAHMVLQAIEAVGEAFLRVIDNMDQLNKTAAGLGMTVEGLQELQYAADLSGVSSEKLTQAMTSLADKVAGLDTASDKASKILRELGVTASDDTGTAMRKLSDAFQRTEDGTLKTAIAVELFGKKVATQMIPLLNSGSEGLNEMAEEAHKLGIVVDNETAKAAEKFNDDLTRLQKLTSSVGIALVKDLLPYLAELTKQLLDNVKAFGLLDGAMQTLMERIFGTVETKFKASQQEVSELTKRLQDLKSGAEQDPFGVKARSVQTELAQAQAELAHNKTLYDQHVINQLLDKDLRERAENTRKFNDAIARAAGKGPATLNAGMLADDEKAKKTAKATKEAQDAMTQWYASLLKAMEATDSAPQKIEFLQMELARLAATGQENSAWAQTLQKELDKLKPDAGALALKKINDELVALATNQVVIVDLGIELEKMAAAGETTGQKFDAINRKLMEMRAAAGDVGAEVRLDLEKADAAEQKRLAKIAELNLMYEEGTLSLKRYTEAIKVLGEDVGKSVDTTNAKVKSLSQSIGEMSAKFVTDFVDQMIDGMGKAEVSFSDMIASFIKQLAKLIVSQELQELVKMFEGLGKDSGGAGGGFLEWIGSLFAAKGRAWSAPGVEYMAQGGILGGPTFFAHGGRLGVAGEAGPEAVVPLQRDAQGDLGVSASPVTVNVINNAGADVTEKHYDNADGSKQIDIYIERKVKDLIAGGSMDRTMRSTYGVARQPALG